MKFKDKYIYYRQICISATVPLAQSGVFLISQRVPCPWGNWIWSILRGRDPGPPPNPCWDKILCFFDIQFISSFFGFWCQLGPNMAPNLGPKSTPNRQKIDKKTHQDVDQFFDRLFMAFGKIFCGFGLEVGRPRASKYSKNWKFFKDFAISAKLPTRGHMINIWAHMTPNLTPKNIQISFQDGPQTDPKPSKK